MDSCNDAKCKACVVGSGEDCMVDTSRFYRSSKNCKLCWDKL